MSITVTISDESVICQRPGGIVESVRWDKLRAVLIQTTDEGPLLDDVFWILIGEDLTGCVVPQGVEGEEALRDRLFKLPGFDYQMVIEAMQSTEDARFLCWERPEEGEA
jgi:hypothetical protein